ncbi:MAG: hypothetical protein ACI38Q_09750 [Candidatus Bruticola sp.]
MAVRLMTIILLLSISTALMSEPAGAAGYPPNSEEVSFSNQLVETKDRLSVEHGGEEGYESGGAASSSNTKLELEPLKPGPVFEKKEKTAESSVSGKWKFGGKAELEYSNDKHPSIVENERGSDMLMYETDKLMPKLELNAKYTNGDFLFYTKYRYRFDKNKIELQDCYTHIPLRFKQKLVLGRFKTRFGIERSQSSSKVITCNPSAVSEAMYLGRAWGASFEFENKKGDQLMLGLMNDHNDHRWTSADNNLAVRGRMRLSDHAYLGTSFLVGRHSVKEGHSLPVQRFGLDYQLKTDNLRIDSEIIYSHGYNGIQDLPSRSFGAYAGTAYTVDKNWDLIGFVDWFDPDLDRCNGFYDDELNSALRYVVGANYYFDRSKDRRIMLNYEWKTPTEGAKIGSRGLYVRWTYEF